MRSLYKLSQIFVICLVFSVPAQAQSVPSLADAQKLSYKTGDIEIGNGLAKLKLGKEFRYANPKDAEFILVNMWHNPPSSAEGNLGMIFPNNGVDPIASWGIMIEFREDGYVSDEGAEEINYDTLGSQIRDAMAEGNTERQKAGYPAMNFVGWAEPPHYDKSKHILYWAKEINFTDAEENTLNYDMRVLGRKGVLILQAIALKSDLKLVSSKMEELLPRIEYNSGNRYTDFNPVEDKVAEYGIAALILGGVAAKSGLLKSLLAILIAGKKFIVIALVAVSSFIKRLFGRQTPAATEQKVSK